MTPPAGSAAAAAGEDALEGVETPAAVVDIARVRANARRVAEYAASHGLSWRPHAKTHKSRAVARLQLEAGAVGLTVATPREAEVMAAVTPDLLLAYPPVGASKLDRVIALPERVSLTVALDSRAALDALAAAAVRAGRRVGVLVELDAGMRRVGMRSVDEVRDLAARTRALDGVEYRGLLFYPGQIRAHRDQQGPELERLSATLDRLLGTLAAADLAPSVVSGGSTPTLFRSHEVAGLTEIRAGTTIFNDREAVACGVARWEDCAYTILATVVSTSVPGQAVVDAGSKALAKEPCRGRESFGALLDRPEIEVRSLSEEHGILDLSATDWHPRVGDRVRIVPNHVCVSANLQEALWAWDGGRLERWEQEARGRSPWLG